MGWLKEIKNKINNCFGMKKTTNYKKELYRGYIKQIMKVRGLRTISLDNYHKWLQRKNLVGVHSLKLDIQDGYINAYRYNDKGRCGAVINDAPVDMYADVYTIVNEILARESKNEIPTKVKRNILVNLSR